MTVNHERGTEIVGTYLALSTPDRRWPSAADVTDLAGGVRQRLRLAGTSATAGCGAEARAGWGLLVSDPAACRPAGTVRSP